MKRIRKQTARKLYNIGFTITLNPCNFRLNTDWHTESNIKKPNDSAFYTESEIDFDSRVNQFEYYNCTGNKTGKYAAYYIPEIITIWYQIDTANSIGYRDTIDIQFKRLNRYLKNYKLVSTDSFSTQYNDIYLIKFTKKEETL